MKTITTTFQLPDEYVPSMAQVLGHTDTDGKTDIQVIAESISARSMGQVSYLLKTVARTLAQPQIDSTINPVLDAIQQSIRVTIT